MNIAMVTPTYLPNIGGLEIAIKELSLELLKRGHKVYVFVPYAIKGYLKNTICKLAGNVHTGDIVVLPFPYSKVLERYSLDFIIEGVMKKEFVKNRIDIIHNWSTVPFGYYSIQANRETKLPVLTLLAAKDIYDPISPIENNWTNRIGYVLNNSNNVVSCSDDQKQRVRNKTAVRIKIIPHGVNIYKFNPNKKSLDLRKYLHLENEIFLFSLQRLHPRKGVEYLIKAMSEIVKKCSNVKLIIGGTGPEVNKLKLLINELKLQSKIELIGFIKDSEMCNYYASCDIFVFHSLYEAFGIVLVEAMASGVPVISTQVGAIPEVVRDKKTGILVPPCDPSALASAIMELIENENLRKRMGFEGRKIIEKEYNWENIVEKYENIYYDLLKKQGVNS